MRKHTRRTGLAAALAATMVVAVSSCASYETQEIDGYVYCVDKDTGEIVDEDYCDSSGSTVVTYWFWTTTERHPHGYHVPAKHHKSFVNPKDPSARAKAGIPRTGKVTSGQKIKSGGFGNGAKGAKVSTGGFGGKGSAGG